MIKDRFGSVTDTFECSCGSPYHRITFNWREEDYDDEFPPELYMEYFFYKVSFFRRLLIGIKYILGFKQDCFADFILKKDDVVRLKESLNRYVLHHNNWIEEKNKSDVFPKINTGESFWP